MRTTLARAEEVCVRKTTHSAHLYGFFFSPIPRTSPPRVHCRRDTAGERFSSRVDGWFDPAFDRRTRRVDPPSSSSSSSSFAGRRAGTSPRSATGSGGATTCRTRSVTVSPLSLFTSTNAHFALPFCLNLQGGTRSCARELRGAASSTSFASSAADPTSALRVDGDSRRCRSRIPSQTSHSPPCPPVCLLRPHAPPLADCRSTSSRSSPC